MSAFHKRSTRRRRIEGEAEREEIHHFYLKVLKPSVVQTLSMVLQHQQTLDSV